MIHLLILIQTLLTLVASPSNVPFNSTPTFSSPLAVLEVMPPSPMVGDSTACKNTKPEAKHENKFALRKVVIDAGHGGHDPGCLGSSTREKHLNLAIARKTAALIRSQHPGVQVIMTRDSDVFIPLHKRASIANKAGADLFISIHCNYMPGSSATRGTETYVMGLHTANQNLEVAKRENAVILLEDNYEVNYDYDPNSPEGHIMLSMYQNAYLDQSIFFAELVEEAFAAASRRSRGVKQAGFVVLKATAMPSVLIESGFLSSSKEERFLNTEEGQMTIASAILKAFSTYKAFLEQNSKEEVVARAEMASLNKAENVLIQPMERSTQITATPKTADQQGNTFSPPVQSGYRITTDPFRSQKEPSLTFHVQLAALPKPQSTTTAPWTNVPYALEVVREDQLYKYRTTTLQTFDHADRAKAYLHTLGFKDAFIVAYQNGKRIDLKTARSLQRGE